MKVNICYKEELFEIAELDVGDCFLYAGHVLMKTNSRDLNAVDLRTGVLRTLTPSLQVLPLDITAINSHKDMRGDKEND